MSKIYDKISNNWDEILDKMLNDFDDTLSPSVFNAFVKPLKVIKYNKNILYIEVPEEGFISILNKKLITNCLKASIEDFLNLSPTEYIDIQYVTKNNIGDEQNIKKNIIDKTLKKLKINAKNTFDTFVVGESNNLAYGSCLAVAENPGDFHFNPLFIYGGTGLGKTHLLHAIAQLTLTNNENFNILYISCQDFVSEFMDAAKQKTLDNFKEKYKNLDLLIVDDVEMISGRTEFQNILFDIFNTLRDQNKQIVFSSDKAPKELDGIQERIISRFSGGQCCDIKLPDYDTRVAILRKKEEEYITEYKIDEEVIQYIAKNITSNIRELEGCLNKIVSWSRLKKTAINLDLAKDLLSDFTDTNDQKITPEMIIQIVSNHLSIDKINICSNKRNKEFVYARDICIYLCRELIQDITQENIGKYFSGKDHSTIIYSYNKIDKRIKTDKNLKKDIEIIKNKIPI